MNLKVPKPCEKCDGVGDVATTIALPVACIVVALQASHPTALLRYRYALWALRWVLDVALTIVDVAQRRGCGRGRDRDSLIP